ncbi:MAG: cytochrome c biogenesis CcdA family protein [Methylophilaceae bacterium]|nr:cytochrome c biogenesis CcdA family protein [Methylophilaceae bacterium]
MIVEFGTYGLGFAAGMLSILSPCVLPLIPILLGSALMTHRYGHYALAAGLAISFTLVGVFIIGLGSAIGLDHDIFRNIAAVLLIMFGLVLFLPALQARFAVATARIGNSGQILMNRISGDSLSGQFSLGLLLGIVWSPCVGPTLGATITLASQGQDMAHTTLMMAMFGLGAGIPLILLGLLSRQAMMKFRNRLSTAGNAGKKVLGALLFAMGVLILSGYDKRFEAMLLQISPDWLLRITTTI